MCIFNLVLHEVFFCFFFPFRVTQEAIYNSVYLATFTVYCIFFFPDEYFTLACVYENIGKK